MSHYKLGAIEVALTLARLPPVDIPFGAGLRGTPKVHVVFISAIKGAAKKLGGKLSDATAALLGRTESFSWLNLLPGEPPARRYCRITLYHPPLRSELLCVVAARRGGLAARRTDRRR